MAKLPLIRKSQKRNWWKIHGAKQEFNTWLVLISFWTWSTPHRQHCLETQLPPGWKEAAVVLGSLERSLEAPPLQGRWLEHSWEGTRIKERGNTIKNLCHTKLLAEAFCQGRMSQLVYVLRVPLPLPDTLFLHLSHSCRGAPLPSQPAPYATDIPKCSRLQPSHS